MEGEEIGIVLSRASELRSKINNCIDERTTTTATHDDDDGDGDEDESLLSIRDALESLEDQLASFQALQQQQRYEREATLSVIDQSRKILLTNLKEYKGEDLEVIRDALAFASETVDHTEDLLLPPYPTRSPHPSNFLSIRKLARNGFTIRSPVQDAKEKEQVQNPKKLPVGVYNLIGMAAKTVLTLVGVISILSLAGFQPRLRKNNSQFKILDFFQKPLAAEEQGVAIQCPRGKVLVMEEGEPRCLVKERVEIPFESVVMTPDISYGCG